MGALKAKPALLTTAAGRVKREEGKTEKALESHIRY